MMYQIGTDAIHDLRREVAARLGPSFDLRTFHDRFLSYGAIPVPLVRDAMLSVMECPADAVPPSPIGDC